MNHLSRQENKENDVCSWLSQIQQAKVETPIYNDGNDIHRSQPWRPHNLPIPGGVDIPAPTRALNQPGLMAEDRSIRSLSPQCKTHVRPGYVSAKSAHQTAAVDDQTDCFTVTELESLSSEASVYEKRTRRKTRHDRYDTSNKKRQRASRAEKTKSKKAKQSRKARQRPEPKLRSSMEVMDNFVSPSVLSHRVTVGVICSRNSLNSVQVA